MDKRKGLFIFFICAGAMFFSLQASLLAQNKDESILTDKRIGSPLIIEQYSNLFSDPVLDSLIYITIKNNKDVLIAMDRMNQAQASKRIAQSAFYPQIDIQGGWTRQRVGGNVSGTGNPLYSSSASLAATANWEIDLFGSVRNKVRSAADLYKVSTQDLYWTTVSICNQMASTYVDLRTYQQQYIVTATNVKQQEKLYDITKARYNAGLVSKVDVAQAKSTFMNSKASLPQLKSTIVQTLNSIYLLMGLQPPQTDSTQVFPLYTSLMTPAPIPVIMDTTNKKIELQSILDRPDIKAQEYTVNSYLSLLKSARRDWYPQFFLKGEVGFSSNNFQKIMTNKNFMFSVSPTVSWTIFDGMSTLENTKLAKSNWEEAINNFNLQVLTALQEVNNALVLFNSYQEQEQYYSEAVNAGVEALNLSIELYKKGLQNFQTVLDAQRSVLQYENTLVSTHGAKVQAFLALIKSLGVQPFLDIKK